MFNLLSFVIINCYNAHLPAWTYHFCQHKADAHFSYLGTPGMTQAQCNGKFVCPKLEALPYQLAEFP